GACGLHDPACWPEILGIHAGFGHPVPTSIRVEAKAPGHKRITNKNADKGTLCLPAEKTSHDLKQWSASAFRVSRVSGTMRKGKGGTREKRLGSIFLIYLPGSIARGKEGDMLEKKIRSSLILTTVALAGAACGGQGMTDESINDRPAAAAGGQ